MKLKTFKSIATLLLLTAVMILPYFVFAQTASSTTVTENANPITMLQNVAASGTGPYAAADENSLPTIMGLVINAALSLLGIIFIILMIVAGYKWMTASGNEEKVDESKSTIKRAIIGLIIVIGSWAIWNFIVANLIEKL